MASKRDKLVNGCTNDALTMWQDRAHAHEVVYGTQMSVGLPDHWISILAGCGVDTEGAGSEELLFVDFEGRQENRQESCQCGMK